MSPTTEAPSYLACADSVSLASVSLAMWFWGRGMTGMRSSTWHWPMVGVILTPTAKLPNVRPTPLLQSVRLFTQVAVTLSLSPCQSPGFCGSSHETDSFLLRDLAGVTCHGLWSLLLPAPRPPKSLCEGRGTQKLQPIAQPQGAARNYLTIPQVFTRLSSHLETA